MNLRNIFTFSICIFINLSIGNIALLMFPDLAFVYRIIISSSVLLIYCVIFHKINSTNKKYTKWQLIGISTLLSLLEMLIACIFTSIGNRLPMDNVITAGMKGIIPVFVFAIVFASPFWIPLALVNFVCLIYTQKLNK